VLWFCCPFRLPEKEKKKETFDSKSCCCCPAKRTTINRGTVTNRPTPARGTELKATKWNNGAVGTGGLGGTHTGKWRRAHPSRRVFCPRQTKKLNQFLFPFLQIVEISTHEILRHDIRRRTLRLVPDFFCQRIYKNLPLDADALYSQLIENGERKSKRDQKGRM
jgi:hypothetical protein